MLNEWQITDFARVKSSETKCDELLSKVTAYADSIGSMVQEAGHLSVMEALPRELHEASRFAEDAKKQSLEAGRPVSSGLSSLDRQTTDAARRMSSSETKWDELAPRATAITDTTGSRLLQDAGRLCRNQ